MHTWRFLIWPALLIPLLVLTGCAVNPATGKKELSLLAISPAEEVALGEKAFPQALQQLGGAYPDKKLDAYVNAVGRRLGSVSHRRDLPYRFAVVNDSTPNAFALPGGFIAITRGLLVGLENEAQLAAVLGHEVGHVTARHAVQGMQRGSLLGLGLTVLSGATEGAEYGGLAQKTGQLAAGLIDKSYSREQERESDRLGIDYMAKAGYNPYGAVQLQEYFFEQVEGGARPHWVSGLFRTHPFSSERLEANRDYVWTKYDQQVGEAGARLGGEEFQAATVGIREAAEGYRLYDEAKRHEAAEEFQQAIGLYLQAVEAAPDEALIYTGLGMAHLRAEDTGPARRYLKQAVRLDDNYYRSHAGLGYLYLKRSDPGRAVTHLEKSMDLLPSVYGAFLLAEGYEQTGRREEALKLYLAVADADRSGKLGSEAAGRARELGAR